jgi:hypothetical protein
MQGQSCSNHPGATVLFFFVFSLLPYLPSKLNFLQVFLPDEFFKSIEYIFIYLFLINLAQLVKS